MTTHKTTSLEPRDRTRAPYEPPAIEQTATFERLQLACARQFGEFECEEVGGPINS